MSSRATWLIGLIACLAVARPASADTFTFVDTTDVVSITQDGSARTLSPVVGNSLCGVENCFVFVATAATPTLSTVTPAKELEYLEPDGVTFSDEVDYGGPQSRGYLLFFGSDQPENFSPVPPFLPVPPP